MRLGLALPHYDFSVPGENPLRFETILETATAAEQLGFDSLWVSDHLTLSIEKYGGGPGEYFAYEPLTTLSALSRSVRQARLGTLVLCEALRPASVAAKTLATLDQLCDGRLDIGVGAGWYERDYAGVGMALPSPGDRLARLAEAVTVLDGLLGGGPFTFDGRYHRARDATNRPPARQTPRPPIIIGGKGDRLLRLVAERADGWNTCWVWTPKDYQERAATLDRACEAFGRDPGTVTRSLGLYALAGEDRGDLEDRYRDMCRLAPGGMLDDVPLARWREGRLVGTLDEIAEQVAGWEALGVSELIVSVGPLPFSLTSMPALQIVAKALHRSGQEPAGG